MKQMTKDQSPKFTNTVHAGQYKQNQKEQTNKKKGQKN